MSGLIPANVLAEVTRGSIEDYVGRVIQAVEDSHARFESETGQDLNVIATFNEHVVVANGDGNVYRASYQPAGDGFSITKVEPVELPVIRGRQDGRRFVERTASEAVEALVAGDFSSARDQIRTLIEAAPMLAPVDQLRELREHLSGMFDQERPWRAFYAEDHERIQRLVWGTTGSAFSYTPQPRYQPLYRDGLLEDASEYASAVEADVGVMAERLEKLWEQTTEAWGEYQSTGAFKASGIARPAEHFETIASDYLVELKALCHLMSEAAKDNDPDTVAARGWLFDQVARQYPQVEVTARLVRRVATEFVS